MKCEKMKKHGKTKMLKTIKLQPPCITGGHWSMLKISLSASLSTGLELTLCISGLLHCKQIHSKFEY